MLNVPELIQKHLILKRPKDKLETLQCPICKARPTDIMQLQLDDLVSAVMARSQSKLIYDAKDQVYRDKPKIKGMRVDDLFQKLVSENRILEYPTNFFVDIRRKKKENNVIK